MPRYIIAALAGAFVATRCGSEPRSLAIHMMIEVDGQTRAHEVVMLEGECGRIEEKLPSHEDFAMVCAHRASDATLLDVSWRTRNGTAEYHLITDVLVNPGETVDFGGSAGTRFKLRFDR